MTINREELKKKVLEAASAEELMEIVQAAGEEITAEEAAQLFEKAQAKKTDKELSLDELEAVSGGDRDWVTEGCAATVEPGSWCDTNDSCLRWSVTYENVPSSFPCPHCGKFIEIGDIADGIPCVFCQGKYVYNYIKKCLDPV